MYIKQLNILFSPVSIRRYLWSQSVRSIKRLLLAQWSLSQPVFPTKCTKRVQKEKSKCEK